MGHDDAQDATTGVYENLPKKKESNYTPIFIYDSNYINEKKILGILKEAMEELVNGEITVDHFTGFYEGFNSVYQMWKKTIMERD